jgi:membrane-bound lytic murein transglycosylase D
MKRLILWTNLLALAACARALPPAPTGIASVPAIPGVRVPDLRHASKRADAVADSTVNELADAAPDADVVPPFDGDEVRWDIDVQSFAEHPRVRYYLEYFQGVSRSGMELFLSRGSRYEAIIRRRFEEEGLPGDLGYLALIESGYSNDAVSRSHAVGMWQFMKGTARGHGMRIDTWVDERRDPMKATQAAARHLRHLRDRFGSLYLAAAAYNAGAGKVSRSLGKLEWDTPADSAGTPPEAENGEDDLDEAASEAETDAAFFRLAGSNLLATETRDYVPKLIAAAIIAKQPERFGITPPAATPFNYDSLIVKTTTGLDVVARLAGASLAEIRELNPQYLRLATPPRTTSVIKLPPGTGERVAAGYADLSRSERVRFLSHVVRRRDGWSTIAARYHLTIKDIRAANPKIRSTRLKVGTRLTIPTVAVPSALAVRAASGPDYGTRQTRVATHRVRYGETLIGIARRYRVSLRALRRVNSLPVEYTLRAGKRLRIPS